MSPSLRSLLMVGAALAVTSTLALSAQAGRNPRDSSGVQHGTEDGAMSRTNPRSEAFREARREARQRGRVERTVDVPSPQARAQRSADQGTDQGVARRVERRDWREGRQARAERAAENPASQDRVEPSGQQGVVRRLERRDWREGRQARVERAAENSASQATVERNTEQGVVRRLGRSDVVHDNRTSARDWRERREERRRVEDGRERRADWRERNEGRRDWVGRDNRHDRWRDARRHEQREYWRNHYRWPRVIIRPSTHYVYRPHWWGQNYFYFDNRYRDYGYDYGSYYRPGYGYYGGQRGSGWATLYPWLRQDAAGRHWVMWNFDDNRNGSLGREEARQANYEFTELADRDRDVYLSDREIGRGLDELRDEYRYSYQYG